MPAVLPESLSTDDYRAQLFRYAQDLDDLLDQHTKLQQRHQALLQLQGRAPNSNDQLLDLICHGSRPLVVTDPNGVIVRANRTARAILQGEGAHRPASSLAECIAPGDRAEFEQLLTRLAADASVEAAILTRFGLVGAAGGCEPLPWTMLAMPVRGLGHSYIYWLLQSGRVAPGAPEPTPQDLLPLDSGMYGVMVTDPGARILAVNLTFCSISEYAPEALIGQPTRLLGSGRHTADFYQSFWGRLKAFGSWTGEFLNRRRSGRIYPEWKTVKAVNDLDGNLLYYIAVVRDISENDNSVEQLSRLAYFDALTGLPNRRMLEDRIAQASKVATRDGAGMSVMFIDLDRFKPINDQLGHDVGDLVLQQIGARLSSAVRGGDTVARVGGDEFVVLLPSTSAADEVGRVAEKILSTLSAPIEVGEHRLLVGASIGCARYPGDGLDAETLMRHADAAMYRGKHGGGNRISFYEQKGEDPPRPALGLDIWGAAGRGELRLVYQPQVTADVPHRLRGCEALLRWAHPLHGEIGPEQFIPVAENNGAIVDIGLWALGKACAQMRAWQRLGMGRFVISVNVSYRQLQDPSFAERVRHILDETGLEPALLELEVTESTSSRLDGLPLEQLQELREIGVQVAIDDFGLGYSSLKRLFSMPADSLKIDRLFVRDVDTCPESRALSNCVVGVGLAMGMQVIAEGIEHQGQLDVLAGQGCHLLQGYLTGAPMEAHAIVEWAMGRDLHLAEAETAVPALALG